MELLIEVMEYQHGYAKAIPYRNRVLESCQSTKVKDSIIERTHRKHLGMVHQLAGQTQKALQILEVLLGELVRLEPALQAPRPSG